MLLHRGYKYRIYPTVEQATRLCQWNDALRFLWNLALEQRLFAYGRSQLDQKYPSAFDQINELTELRKMLPWLADVPRDVSAQLLVELDAAWQRCFKRIADAPRFKRKRHNTVSMTEPHAKAFRVDGQTVMFPKVGVIPAVIHRSLSGTPKRCTIVRDGNQWFASILCEVETTDPPPSIKPLVAIDRGVAVLLADSDGGMTANPHVTETLQPHIRCAQRTVARRKKGSKNQQKAKAKVARLQRKARRQREHVLHVASSRYTKNHGVIVIEALEVQNMTRSAKGTTDAPGINVRQKSCLNRAILDAGWGKFAWMLKYKAAPEGARVLEVNPAYSSQTCAECGYVDAASRRSQSIFICTACGHTNNADWNAAAVLKTRGIAALAVESTETVCGGNAAQERPVKQKLRVVRRGTRRVSRAGVVTTKP